MKIWVAVAAFLMMQFSFAQDFNQTIRGKITDKVTNEPLIGASIVIVGTSDGTTTNENGEFSLELPTGRYSFQISFVGYAVKTESEVLITSSKETVLNIGLEYDNNSLEEVVIRSNAPITTIGKREITIEQTKRWQ